MFNLLIQLLNTWQVIAVTIVIILYISLVNYVARTHHRPRLSKSKPKKAKKTPAEKLAKKKPTEEETNEELGLEEA